MNELRRENESFNSPFTTRKDLSNRIDLPEVQPWNCRLLLNRRLEERLSSLQTSSPSHQKPWSTFGQSDQETQSTLLLNIRAEDDDDAEVNCRSFLNGEERSTSWNKPRANDFEEMKALQFSVPMAVNYVSTLITPIRTMMFLKAAAIGNEVPEYRAGG